MATEQLTRLIERLERELNFGRMSLALYVAGNGKTATDREALHVALDETYAANAFRHVQHIALTDTLLVVARITDKADNDRHCLPLLKSRLYRDKSVIVDSATNWTGARHDDGSMTQTGLSYKKMVEEGLPKLISDISELLKSPGLEAIRSMRDRALAHALDVEHLPVLISEIETAFHESDRLVAQASLLVKGIEWDPEQFNQGPLLYANELWDALEVGLIAIKKDNAERLGEI